MSRRILVVDDDEAIRTWLVRLLGDAGYTVLTVSSVEEGKKVLVSGSPDLLITDVRMGAFNGLQLVAMNPSGIPTVVITGHDDPVVEADARRMGAEFLLKPVAPGDLLQIVEAKLSGGTAEVPGNG